MVQGYDIYVDPCCAPVLILIREFYLFNLNNFLKFDDTIISIRKLAHWYWYSLHVFYAILSEIYEVWTCLNCVSNVCRPVTSLEFWILLQWMHFIAVRSWPHLAVYPFYCLRIFYISYVASCHLSLKLSIFIKHL